VIEQHHWRWLAKKVPIWIESGVLTPEQGRRLLVDAPTVDGRSNLAVRILIAISALLFGLGAISFFAFNWAAMPKWLKLLTVFGAFIAVHIAGAVSGSKPERSAQAEFFHLLGTLFFGAAIMLIAQIYHIDEHFPNGVLLWSLGALLMAVSLNSTPQMVVYAALLVVWQFMERRYDLPQAWAVALAAGTLVPFAVYKKHAFAVAVAVIAVVIVTTVQLSYHRIGVNGSLFLLGVLCLGVARRVRTTSQPALAVPLETVGGILYYAMLTTLLFAGGVKAGLVEGWGAPAANGLLLPGTVVTTALAVWAAALYPWNTFLQRFWHGSDRHTNLPLIGLLIAAAVWLAAIGESPARTHHELSAVGVVLFNALAAGNGIALIFAGTRTGRVGASFVGCLLVVIIILSRFLAYSDDLLVRAVAFALAGAFILVIALKTSRVKKERVRS
jgi:uncharacterized membrane protein